MDRTEDREKVCRIETRRGAHVLADVIRRELATRGPVALPAEYDNVAELKDLVMDFLLEDGDWERADITALALMRLYVDVCGGTKPAEVEPTTEASDFLASV